MPFSRDYYFKRFNTAELEMLQAAYLKTCEVLEQCPVTSPQKDEMAREIIQIYECGIFNPDKIAQLMFKVESVKPKTLIERVFEQPSILPAKRA